MLSFIYKYIKHEHVKGLYTINEYTHYYCFSIIRHRIKKKKIHDTEERYFPDRVGLPSKKIAAYMEVYFSTTKCKF